MFLDVKKLSFTAIDSSPEITQWLSQFSEDKRSCARSLLANLNFISWDVYSKWLRATLNSLPEDSSYGLYAVRKRIGCLWDQKGITLSRPGTSLGSEDLVYSLVKNVVSSAPQQYYDHPSLDRLKKQRVNTIVLIDDSIGSGKRVTEFIRAMRVNATFKSWWSYGILKIIVVAYARRIESDSSIIEALPGSDHWKRKFPRSNRIQFISKIEYRGESLLNRWGPEYNSFIKLCDEQEQVEKKYARGYGGIMSNVIFYHSVPNNIPGVLFSSNNWNPLFPGRAIPDWLIRLLERKDVNQDSNAISPDMVELLGLAKYGVRRLSSLSARMDRNLIDVIELAIRAQKSGFLLKSMRITETGLKVLKQIQSFRDGNNWKERLSCLYIPKSWCTGRSTVQSSVLEETQEQTDSASTLLLADGELGQSSLARSDAKTALPSTIVNGQEPLETRQTVNNPGPLD